MWPLRQSKRYHPEIVIAGLTGTGKTLVAKTLLRWGLDMGPLEELWTQSLEHPVISRAAKKICGYYDPAVNPGYVINPAFHREASQTIPEAIIAPLQDEQGRSVLKLPQWYPQVVKIPYVAAMPTLLTVMQPPKVIIWCSRDFERWSQVVTNTDFFLEQRSEEIKHWALNPQKRGVEPRYPDLTAVWEAEKDVLDWVLVQGAEWGVRVLTFDVDTMTYGVARTGAYPYAFLGMMWSELTERTKEEASGRGDHFRARAHRFGKVLREGRPALRRDDFGRHSPGQAVAAPGPGSPGVFRFGGRGLPPQGS